MVCVIHQPSQEVWDLLDDVWLMKSGHLIFQGPKEEALKHMFAVIPLPKWTEPAEHLREFWVGQGWTWIRTSLWLLACGVLGG